MKKRLASLLLGMMLLVAPASVAQEPTPRDASSANRLCAELKQAADGIAANLLRLAERMPADEYGFQVVPDIPRFGSTLGYAIDARMRTCSEVTGSGRQVNASRMEAKANLVAALKASIAECDQAFAGLTDAALLETSPRGAGGPRSLLSSLWGMVAHDSEGYGALALHLRLRGIEPPDLVGTLVR